MTISPARFAEVYNDVQRYPSLQAVADALDLGLKTVKNRAGKMRSQSVGPQLISRKRDAEVGRLGFDPVLPGYRVSRTAVEQDGDGEVTRRWIEQKPERGEVFELPVGQVVKGVSALVDEDGRTIAKWIKTREDHGVVDLIEAVRDAFGSYAGAAAPVPAPHYANGDLLTVYPIADLHLGMHAWGKETGENYDIKIAERRAVSMLGQLVAQSQPSQEALILQLGDFFHMNDQKNMTPRSGHILDVDGRWPKVLATGVRLMMKLIDLALTKHQVVRVKILPGNHDPDAAVALSVALSIFYESHERVIIDDSPSLIFYYRFGKVLLGATHGHTMKPDRMAMAMATDCPVEWGLTIFKHVFFGHIHHESAKEIGPVRVESLNTIAAKDAHAHNGGYRSGQAMNAITFHKELGEVGRHRINVLPALAA